MFSWNTVLYPMSQFLHKITNLSELPFAEKHSAPKPDITLKCELGYAELSGFYALRQYTKTQHAT